MGRADDVDAATCFIHPAAASSAAWSAFVPFFWGCKGALLEKSCSTSLRPIYKWPSLFLKHHFLGRRFYLFLSLTLHARASLLLCANTRLCALTTHYYTGWAAVAHKVVGPIFPTDIFRFFFCYSRTKHENKFLSRAIDWGVKVTFE